MEASLLREGETADAVCGGRLRVIQKKRGYRFSLDALLLAHFARLRPGEDLIDLGTGAGVVALILADRFRCGRVLGVDVQEGLVEMARRSVQLNGLQGRVAIESGDVRQPAALCAPQSFSAAVFNPPYRRLMSGRMNPDSEKAVARHELAGCIGDFIAAADHALRPEGRAYAIYPAARMVELLARMRRCRIEPKRLQMVHSRRESPGAFVLLEAVKGGREELKVLPPLFIYGETGVYTAAMAAIFTDLSASPAPCGG